jgi:tetratricopeptide (TPR) repeat protein
MTRAGQSKINERIEALRLLAIEQKAACLSLLDRTAELESMLAAAAGSMRETGLRFHFAIALARQGQILRALDELRGVLARESAHRPARSLAYRILLHRAGELAGQGDYGTISDLMTEALHVAPEGADPQRDFGRFGSLLAVAHIRAGNRREAVKVWERSFRDDYRDYQALHNLALVHYWGAEGSMNGDSASMWEGAIAYWTVIACEDGFWKAWGSQRARLWQCELPGGCLDEIRAQFIETNLERRLADGAIAARHNNQPEMASFYDRHHVLALRERKCAELWRAFAARHGLARGAFALGGGYLFFERLGLLDELIKQAEKHSTKAQANEKEANAWMRIYFSKEGLGKVAVMIEAQKQPEHAIEELDRMGGQPSAEKTLLRGQALIAKARLRAAGLSFDEQWKLLYEAAERLAGVHKPPAYLACLFEKTRTSLQEYATEIVTKEVARLKDASRLPEALQILEKSRYLDSEGKLLDLYCVSLCDRAEEALASKRWNDCRRDLEKVLQLRPDNLRAKQRLSTCCNNEAVDTADTDKAIALYEKALVYNPENENCKRNLADALAGKALKALDAFKVYRSYSRANEAVGYGERALKILNPDLSPSSFELMVLPDPELRLLEVQLAKLNDDLYKGVLRILAISYQLRARMQGRY